MDWIKSALEPDEESEDENECVKSVPKSPPKETKTKSQNFESEPRITFVENPLKIALEKQKESKNDDEKAPGSKSQISKLFSIEQNRRCVELLNSDEIVKVNVPNPTEDDFASFSSDGDVAVHAENALEEPQRDAPVNSEMVDYSQVLQSFNVSGPNCSIKASKRREWREADFNIVDVHANDLRMSKAEKTRRYSSSKEALMEGREEFKLPTRLMETAEGELITTNMIRRTQKRKHQINWLAQESHERELELLEANAQMRKTKHETHMKYGW